MDIVSLYASSKPAAPALVEGERVVSWAELAALRNRCARALRALGLGAGERIVAYHANSIDGFVASLGAQAVGLTVVPLNHRLTAPEARYIVDDSDAAGLVQGEEFDGVVDELETECGSVRHWIRFGAPRGRRLSFGALLAGEDDAPLDDAAEQAATMIYTSGTTGKPKGAMRTNMSAPAQLGYLQSLIAELGLRPGEAHLAAGPLYHSAPRAFAGVAMALGNTLVLMRKFEPAAALDLIERHAVGDTFMAPVLIKRLLALPDDAWRGRDLSSLHTLIVAGAPCPMTVKRGVAERLGPVLYEFYGSTELGVNTLLKPADQLRKPGSCGQLFPGVAIRLVDANGDEVPEGTPGEVHVARNQQVFDGYHKRASDVHDADGVEWISVGDIAYRDAEGFYFICDRKNDMIISGGVNIYPAEIEQALVEHPAIADAAVFAIPDEEWGEAVHAVLGLEPDVALSDAEVRAWLEPRLAHFKHPRSIQFVDRLPRDNAGKLLKRTLREPFWAGRERGVN
ncbi:MAG: AMP-binding protein [Deltaproteobacteria bacterium]|nr:AMP-binding protein [Deltaproteobacteria bacterium]